MARLLALLRHISLYRRTFAIISLSNNIYYRILTMIRQTLYTIVVAALTAYITLKIAQPEYQSDNSVFFQTAAHNYAAPLNFPEPLPEPCIANLPDRASPDNFILAAQIATPTVVNIKTSSPKNKWGGFGSMNDVKAEDWTNPKSSNGASGSGVIISSDGYIVTNTHVVTGSTNIEVTLYNRQTYTAQLIADDPNTDIALIKINAYGLQAANYGNSDNLQVGEWVLAVGNPFNLFSTVTAGIVSAKGRNINILQTREAIESFIQTDAVVNPGNSGGALINTAGELVGINTAIASGSGAFEGYSFAVPVNLVRKVVEDLKKYGIVQSASLGVRFENVTNSAAQQYNLNNTNGVLINAVIEGSAASEVGLKKGDVITEINGMLVNSAAELQEKIGRFSPGDNIAITYYRNRQQQFISVKLKNPNGQEAPLLPPKESVMRILGAELQELSLAELQTLGLRSGMKVVKLANDGPLRIGTNIKVGFIVEMINKKPIYSYEDANNVLKDLKNGKSATMEGIYDKGNRLIYTLNIK
jgi:serine protease Do